MITQQKIAQKLTEKVTSKVPLRKISWENVHFLWFKKRDFYF